LRPWLSRGRFNAFCCFFWGNSSPLDMCLWAIHGVSGGSAPNLWHLWQFVTFCDKVHEPAIPIRARRVVPWTLPQKNVSTISNHVLAPFIERQRFLPIKFHHFAQATNEKMAWKRKCWNCFNNFLWLPYSQALICTPEHIIWICSSGYF
jgi:hypothetical protein